MPKNLTLIERKTKLYNRLSKEIEDLIFDCHGMDKRIVMYKEAKKQIRLHRETQKLLDDIFNGEIEV